MTDQLQKFLFQQAAVRGEFVEMTEAWKQIQSNHHYPFSVTRLLGEMIVQLPFCAAISNSMVP